MTLDDAYQALGLKPPWEHEERIRDRHAAQFAKQLRARTQQSYDRAIGSTQHMLIELYLDLEQANRTVSPTDIGKIKFLVVVLNESMANSLRQQLAFLHSQLKLYVSLSQVKFLPYNKMESLRGSRLPSWGVFCDNSVKENILDLDRPSGPFRYIRRLVAKQNISMGGFHGVPEEFEAFDRDDNLVCRLPNLEINDILKGAECPIIMGVGHTARNYEPVSYPAWSEDHFQSTLNYKPQFKV